MMFMKTMVNQNMMAKSCMNQNTSLLQADGSLF